jgi:hypothetical protein
MELRAAVLILVEHARGTGPTEEAARIVLTRLKEQEEALKLLPAMAGRLEKALEGA